MADLSDIIAQINQAVASAGASEEITKKIRDSIASVVSHTQLAVGAAATMDQAFSDSTQGIVSNLLRLGGGFETLDGKIRDNTDGISALGLQAFLALEPLIGILEKGSAAFGNFGSMAHDAGIGVTDSFGALVPILQKIMSPTKLGVLTSMAEAADSAQGLELGLLRAAAESGQLSEVLGQANEGLGRMPDFMAQYNTWVERAADSSGKLSSEVTKWGELLLKIPGSMEQAVAVQAHEAGDEVVQLSLLDAAIKVANGTRQTEAEVLESLRFSYRSLNVTGQQALEWIAEMGTVADESNLPIDIMRESVTRTADSYKLFGDNTRGAIAIMGQFAQALRGSNLGPEGIREVVDGITSGIQRMDIAQRSFISAASGGRGGAAGGLQIELLLQQGRLEDVQRKAREAISRQFGGPTLTLEQANQNPALAGRFLQQREMVKQFGLASTDAGANRVLEAWNKGLMAAPERTGQQALQQAVERGTGIQEAQRSVLVETRNYMQELTREKATQMLAVLRSMQTEDQRSAMEAAGAEGYAVTQAGPTGAADTRTTRLASVGETFERMQGRLREFGDKAREYMAPAIEQLEEHRRQVEGQMELPGTSEADLARLQDQKAAITRAIEESRGAPVPPAQALGTVAPEQQKPKTGIAVPAAGEESASNTVRIRVDIADSLNTLVSKAVKAYFSSQGVTGVKTD